MTELKVLKLAGTEKDKLLNVYATAGMLPQGNKQIYADPLDTTTFVFEPLTDGERILAEYVLAH